MPTTHAKLLLLLLLLLLLVRAQELVRDEVEAWTCRLYSRDIMGATNVQLIENGSTQLLV